jgi:NAD(P)H-hydrate epimerase
MKRVTQAKEMQAIDRLAIEEYGVSGLTLMENAGHGVVVALEKRFNNLSNKRVVVFCGKGNNGGDGFVIARHLFNLGTEVITFLIGRRVDLKDDTAVNAESAINLGIAVQEVNTNNLSSLDPAIANCDLIVDTLFGTGLTRPATGLYEQIIKKINAAEEFVVAVDIPSGIDSDTGQLLGPHVKANLTFALGLLKRGHLLHPAAEAMGEVEILDIGLPCGAVDSQQLRVRVTEEEDLCSWFRPRSCNSHKGSYGHVLVIAGSRGKGGAAGLAALAALRTGCGLVTLALPEGCQRALEFHPLEVMTVSAPETPSGSFAPAAKEVLLDQCKGKSAVVIGPGLSTAPETIELLSNLLPEIDCPMVIDADGLNGLAQHPGLLSTLKSDTVLTPHPKEMSRLLGLKTEDILKNRIETAAEFACKHALCLVLKGAASLIALPDGSVTINPTGNPGMATAGSGDVLTGIIASIIAQGLSYGEAAIAGAYLQGLAGDIFAKTETQTSLIAGDLLRTLPESLKRILP